MRANALEMHPEWEAYVTDAQGETILPVAVNEAPAPGAGSRGTMTGTAGGGHAAQGAKASQRQAARSHTTNM